jgi:hypothetical protein
MACLFNSWNLILAKGPLKPDSLFWSNSIVDSQAHLGFALWDWTFSTEFFCEDLKKNIGHF